MLSNLLNFLFIASAYSPILLIYWVVSVIKTNCYKTHWIFLLIFLAILLLCWSILYLIKRKLTRNSIEIRSLKSVDNNFKLMIVSYTLPCVDLFTQDPLSLYNWFALIVLFILFIFMSKGSFYYNPILKFVFGYRYYEIQTKEGLSCILLSQKKLINTSQVKTYSQLTDYVIIDATTQ